MKRSFFTILCLFGLVIVGAAAAYAQTAEPTITTFTTSNSFVNRSELASRTARVPVRWTTQNRPIGANLVFEQVLPNGGFINVELPRLIPWVSSNGEGVAAPLLPDADATEIVLRVRLVNMIDGSEYDARLISLPIRDDTITNPPEGTPQITAFTADNRVLDRQVLLNRNERVRVTWASVNRPAAATLVFEQVFADGTYANIELPRDNPWVNPSDSGTVAPFATDANINGVTLRVRMVNILNGFTYDQRTVTLAVTGDVDTATPVITNFSAGVASASAVDLANRQLIIPVTWNVESRPENSNLVFEQVLPGGSTVNVELPRDFVRIPSAGNGYVQPYAVNGAAELVLQLRLVNTRTGQALTSQQLKIPVVNGSNPAFVVVSGEACYAYPFAPNVGIGTGTQVETQRQIVLNTTSGPESSVVRTLDVGETLNVTGTPYCYRPFSTDEGISFRQWQVRTADGTTGWVLEYSGVWDSITRNIALKLDDDTSGDDDTETIAIKAFNVSPNPAPRFSTVTIDWRVTGPYNRIDVGWYPSQLWLGETYRESLYSGRAADSSVQVELDSMQVDDVRFVIDVFTADGALAATQDLTLDLTCAASLSFNDPENADECALPELQVNAAYQTFENGFMVWRDDLDWIIVAYDDGTYRVYQDQWNGQTYTIEDAPAERIAPERGFGYLWVNNPDVQERLGWATGTEISFTMKTQQLDKRGSRGTIEGEWYYALPNGRSIRTQYSTTGSWTQLQ